MKQQLLAGSSGEHQAVVRRNRQQQAKTGCDAASGETVCRGGQQQAAASSGGWPLAAAGVRKRLQKATHTEAAACTSTHQHVFSVQEWCYEGRIAMHGVHHAHAPPGGRCRGFAR